MKVVAEIHRNFLEVFISVMEDYDTEKIVNCIHTAAVELSTKCEYWDMIITFEDGFRQRNDLNPIDFYEGYLNLKELGMRHQDVRGFCNAARLLRIIGSLYEYYIMEYNGKNIPMTILNFMKNHFKIDSEIKSKKQYNLIIHCR